MDNIELMLKELTEASGVSGYEEEARGLMRKYLAPLGELSQDKLGSLICRKQGAAAAPRIMLAGHVDEIGFMVKHITKEGFIHFTTLGGWPNQHLPAQRVIHPDEQGQGPRRHRRQTAAPPAPKRSARSPSSARTCSSTSARAPSRR